MALSENSHSFVLNSTYAVDANETFNLSYWSQFAFAKQFIMCRDEFFFIHNDETLLQLQTKDNMKFIERRCEQARMIRHLFMVLPFFVGIPANIIALVALSTLRPRSIGLFYIALLAASDLGALVMKLVDYLLIDNRIDTSSLLCGLVLTLLSFFPCFANWMLVVISFERYYTLRFPLHKAAHFTFGRARLLVACLGLLLFLYHLPRMFLVQDPDGSFCPEEDSLAQQIMAEVDNVLHFYLPQILIFFLLALIAHCLVKAQKAREKMFTGNSVRNRPGSDESEGEKALTTAGESRESRHGSGMPLNQHTTRMLKNQRRNERSLTIMMFCAAIFFLVMTFPLVLMMHFQPDPMIGVAEMNFKFYLILAQGLHVLTHIANFFLYFIACRRMRSHLFHMIGLSRLQKLCGCIDEKRVSITDIELTKASRLLSDNHVNNE